FIADQVDVPDLGGLAFLDLDRDVDAVAVEAGDRRDDLDVVLAAVVVLPGQLLGDTVQGQPVEGLALGQPDVAQPPGQVLGLDVLVAAQGEPVDRRPFGDGDPQDVALAPDRDVLEEPGAVQRADRLADAGLVDGVAALDRQVGEHRAGADALQPVDADV